MVAKSSTVRSSRSTQQLVDPVGAVRRRELGAEQVALAAAPLVGGDDLAVGGHVVARQVDPAGPRRRPGRDRRRCRAGWPRAAAAPGRRCGTAPTPLGVGDDDVVDRLDPGVEGAVDVVDGPRPQQREQGVEAEVAEHGRGVAQAQPAAAVAVDLEQRAALGGQHLDGHRVGAAHRDGLLVAVDHVVERLLEDVLVVGHRVGDRPRHRAGVREVLDAGHAREGEPDDVERVGRVLAGQPDLGVDARRLDHPVRVTADQRQAARGPGTADRPGVAARAVRRVAGEQRLVGAEHRPGAVVPELGGQAREQQVLGVEDGQRRPRLPRRRLEVEPLQLRGVRVQPGVDALDERRRRRPASPRSGRRRRAARCRRSGPAAPRCPRRPAARRAPRRRSRWPGGAGTPAARPGPAPRRTPARGRGRARRWPGCAGRRTRRGRSGPPR